jgi:prolyl oligopeptidase
MKRRLAITALVLICTIAPRPALAAAPALPPPPVAPVRPVTDDYFGIKVVDPYRYMENLSDPAVQKWMKAQADYTRAILDRIPGRAALLADMQRYVNAVPATVGSVTCTYGGRYFFLKTLSGQNVAKLYMRQGLGGKDVLLVDTNRFTGPGGAPPAINYYIPSFDGRYVAYGVSEGGSENATLHVVDADTGKDLPLAITRAEFGGVSWLPGNHSFLYNRLQKLAPGASPLDKFLDSKVYLHVLGQPVAKDVAVFGRGVSPGVEISPIDEPFVATQPGSDYAVGVVDHGVRPEQTLYVAPLASLSAGAVSWVKLCDTNADVTNFTYAGDTIYLLTHRDAPRYLLLRGDLGHPHQPLTTFLPQQAGVLKDVDAAADGLYVTELDDGIYHILRIPPGGRPQRIPLPFAGTASVYPADPRLPGIVFALTSWTKALRIDRFDPTTDRVEPTTLRPVGPYDNLPDLTSLEVKAPSYDGTLIPLSITFKKGIKLDGKNPTVLWAYGAYGMTEDPGYSPAWLPWLNRGGIFAVAHVRGGGEEGEAWHLAGYKLTKPNTWRDTIACAEYLIDKKYTSPSHLGVMGGSAGGITIGRFITERPDLCAAAVIESGVVNAIRSETSPNGPPNIPEFGSVKTQAGFEDLYAMDAYHHVRNGVPYPAVMLTTGINDPRVAPWEPAKMAARLQAATSSGKPILLRIDYEGGHGIGESRKQGEEELADTLSFFLWQFGDPAFAPKP